MSYEWLHIESHASLTWTAQPCRTCSVQILGLTRCTTDHRYVWGWFNSIPFGFNLCKTHKEYIENKKITRKKVLSWNVPHPYFGGTFRLWTLHASVLSHLQCTSLCIFDRKISYGPMYKRRPWFLFQNEWLQRDSLSRCMPFISAASPTYSQHMGEVIPKNTLRFFISHYAFCTIWKSPHSYESEPISMNRLNATSTL